MTRRLRWHLPALLALLASLLLALPPAARADDSPVTDPIPEDPAPSGLGIELKEMAQFPKSEPTPPATDPRLIRHARINYLGEVPDHSGRFFVPDLNGKLYFLDRKTRTPRVYLDVGAAFAPDFFSGKGMGQGFGFVTFAPDFRRSGRFYTVHTESGNALTSKKPDLTPQANTLYHGVVTEWTAKDPKAATFSGTHREVLRLGFAGQIHGIQQIDFNPTARPGDADYGLLYVAAGDGGQGQAVGDNEPQTLGVPQGKILRIDPRGRNSANGQYGIPAANPFTGKPGALGEIYAYGMRDPHRFTWDPAGSHRLFLAHIGEHEIEAVYEVRAGDNLGWPEREGPYRFDKSDRCHLYPLPADDAKNGYDYPVAAYDHDPPADWKCNTDVGRAIAGGFVYRGHDLPGLYGKYVFDDLVDGRVFYTDEKEMRRGQKRAQMYTLQPYVDGRPVTMAELAGDKRVDLRFGRDGRGELYLIAKANGKIWKVTGTRKFASCQADTRVSHVMAQSDWAPVTPSKWRFPGNEVILAEEGQQRPGPRRPFEYAVLSAGPEWGNSVIDADVRLDTPVPVTNRDVILVFGYQSDTRFYYTHLSSDNTIYPHNGIFVVNDADRLRLDQQWNASRSHGAPPAIRDAAYHHVRVVRCGGTGEIAVYVDRSRRPLMTAVDTTFRTGRVGFGSFDNIGRIRDLTVAGTRAA